MSKIEIGRYSEMLRRLLGQKGQEFVATELSPEVSATLELEAARYGAEWEFLKGVRLCGASARIVGGAGTSRFRLRNPAASGVIATFDYIEMVAQTVTFMGVGYGEIATDLGVSTIDTTVLDTRWRSPAIEESTALVFSVDNLTNVDPEGSLFVRTRRLVDEPYFYKQQVVLPPGATIDWGTLTGQTNVTLQCSVRWRERGVPALEL